MKQSNSRGAVWIEDERPLGAFYFRYPSFESTKERRLVLFLGGDGGGCFVPEVGSFTLPYRMPTFFSHYRRIAFVVMDSQTLAYPIENLQTKDGLTLKFDLGVTLRPKDCKEAIKSIALGPDSQVENTINQLRGLLNKEVLKHYYEDFYRAGLPNILQSCKPSQDGSSSVSFNVEDLVVANVTCCDKRFDEKRLIEILQLPGAEAIRRFIPILQLQIEIAELESRLDTVRLANIQANGKLLIELMQEACGLTIGPGNYLPFVALMNEWMVRTGSGGYGRLQHVLNHVFTSEQTQILSKGVADLANANGAGAAKALEILKEADAIGGGDPVTNMYRN